MRKITRSKGFSLIEMLIVIAIIAILASAVIPVVTSAITKAKAATDAANLRSILALSNTLLLDNDTNTAATIAGLQAADSVTFPGAIPYIYYVNPGFVIAYYAYNGSPYTVESFAEAASSGKAPEPATLPAGGTSYPVGGSGT